MAGIIIIILGAILFIIAMMPKKNTTTTTRNLPDIIKTNSISDVVMSINHGRVYPYFTGMSLEQVKRIVRESSYYTTDFDNNLHLQELMGNVRGVTIPLPPRALVTDIYLHLNKSKVVSSITIGISNLDFVKLVEQMTLKFGNPFSFDRQFMTWRDTHMTITLDSVNKYINVMDERLPNR